MTKLLKFLFVLGVIGAVVVLVAKSSRKRATAPAWQPPVVETPPPGAETPVATDEAEPPEPVSSTAPAAVVEAEDECLEAQLEVATEEGMTPPPGSAPEDIALDAEGETVLSELSPPEAEAAALAAVEEFLAEASLDLAVEEDNLPEALRDDDSPVAGEQPAAPFATADSEVEALDAEAALLDALAESEAREAAGAAVPAEEAPLDAALHGDLPGVEVEEAIPALEAALDEAEAAGRAGDAAPVDEDADILTRAFDELAATTDAQPIAPAATEPEVRADEHLLSSVEEALVDLEPAPIVPPPRRTAESYLDEGNVYFNVGQYGLAIERYGAAISMDATLTAAYYNRANAHTRAGEFEKALADYDRALELQPMDADALNNRGMLHLYRSNYANALGDFNRALELDPGDTTVMVNRGLAQLHSGNAAAALVDFREAANMDTGDAAAQYGAAQAAATMGNRDEALRHVARALELDSGYAREAAADPRLALLSGDDEFLRLLRQSGARSG